jgi:hypothetical protein
VIDHSKTAIAEMVIPDAVDAMIHDHGMTCDVLSSPDARHGVTNPDDKPRVQEAFDKMIQDNVYPNTLWNHEGV